MQKFISPPLSLIAALLLLSCSQQQSTSSDEVRGELEISFRENVSQQRVDVLIDGNLFTAYRWPDGVFKPVLYPLMSSAGNPITRGFPLEPRKGESADHRHQVGNWLNYGNVNGYDFWGNGHSGERLPNGGEIQHVSVEKMEGGKEEATMTTTAQWVDPSGQPLLDESTAFHFKATDSVRMIDRVTTLKANHGQSITFKDTKEGMFGLRVARQLELPGEKDDKSAGAEDNLRPTGNYRSSEGVTGEKVWSTRAKWMDLHGKLGNEDVSVVIFDHPKNINYPTYWHARGYGLFAANPLGVKDFTEGKEEFNLSLAEGDSLTFRYRIMITSGHQLTDDEINQYADAFAAKY